MVVSYIFCFLCGSSVGRLGARCSDGGLRRRVRPIDVGSVECGGRVVLNNDNKTSLMITTQELTEIHLMFWSCQIAASHPLIKTKTQYKKKLQILQLLLDRMLFICGKRDNSVFQKTKNSTMLCQCSSFTYKHCWVRYW